MSHVPDSLPLCLSGAPNFRDLAGWPRYHGQDGRRLRAGRVFRSDHLAALDATDLQRLQGPLGGGVRVLDLRGVHERSAAPCAIPWAQVHSLAIEPTIVQKLTDLLAAGHALSAGDTVDLMQDTYRGFVRHNTPRFAQLFAHLLQDAATPVVFHCTAGKDRTGFAAALLLRVLGVPHEVVLQDYLLTNERLQHRAPASAMPAPIVHVLHRVQVEFLAAAFEAVEQDHGSLDAYVRDGLMVGPAELAQLRLQMLA